MNLKVKGKGRVTLSKADFVASGGEGSVYRRGSLAYKVYNDPKKMIPVEKIRELSVLTLPQIIRPQDVLLDDHDRPVGYTMTFLSGAFTLCQLFTKAFGSDFTFADLRATAAVYLPLPFWARHTLQLSLRGRGLAGAPARLLRVGGLSRGFLEWDSQEEKSQPGTGLAIFPDIKFREPLRGYEDATLRTNQVLIAGFRYRAPIIVDFGWASFLWILPSFFIRQADLEGFGEWAHTWTSADSTTPAYTSDHRTLGAALYLRTLWGSGVPLSFYYQFAWRPDDGLTPLHIIGVALE